MHDDTKIQSPLIIANQSRQDAEIVAQPSSWRLDNLIVARLKRLSTSPYVALETPYKFSLFRHFSTQYHSARMAIACPPQWDSISALEADWQITARNRQSYIWIHRVYVLLLSAVLIAIVVGLISLRASSLWLLFSGFLISIATCFVLLLVISVSLWRIDVLTSRNAQSYVQWIRVRRR